MSNNLIGSRLFGLSQRLSCLVLNRTYAAKPAGAAVAGGKKTAKKAGKLGPIVEKVKIPAESDTKRLANYVCGSNIYLDGEDVKIGPESEYPEWLFQIHVGKPKTLEELDPTTKAYWRKLRTEGLRRNNKLSKLRRF